MAQTPSVHRTTVTVIRDKYGQPILRQTLKETTVFGADGSATKYREHDSIELVCGSVYNPVHSMGQTPVMLLGVCESCRQPRFSVFGHQKPTHGLCSRAAGQTCAGCGAFLCPAHAIQSPRDGNYRCRSCHRRYSMLSLLSCIFFVEEK